LKNKAKTIVDISVDIITALGLVNKWDNENWKEYKELMKEELKRYNIKLSKAIIQQLTEDNLKLKVAMYRLLIEVDGIQEQFKNADLKQGQKVTMFYISDWGGIITSRITIDKVENTKYAQYDNAIKLTFAQQGKKGLYTNSWYSTLLVYDGWLELPVEVLHIVENTSSMTITKGKYSSCDNRQYDAILEHFSIDGITPVINTYKPLF
jgi:hypothetical protein